MRRRLMPTRREENKLKGLLEELKAFESSSKNLQSADGLSLLDVRDIFDALIAEHPGVLDYLGSDAAIVQQPEFEDACVTCSDGARGQETWFCRPSAEEAQTAACEYPELKVVPPTSNMCERFFSQVKYVLGSHRQGLLPINLEMILFLKVYRHLWSGKTVADVVNPNK
ncbi:hypothetical protein PF004_g19300 [Phytophthora fragariae]|uniref:HAT C-terminal dimerisation domain-containing protein n=1 Tax=Phytophthora fragariae TaxID=53985 RepID=A0A6G0N989_9STRA|nr:hypothetical protein PF004_g19300 [Phytophthora fragariae]